MVSGAGSPGESPRTPAARREEARGLIADAVRLRLRCGRAGGAGAERRRRFLGDRGGGGSPGCPVDAFTVIAEGDETDLPYARQAARRYGLRHEVLRAPAATAAERVLDAADTIDEPFADSSALSSLELARSLAGRYKVILNGDGGDEAFGGYRHYKRIAVKQAVKAAAAAVGLVDGQRRDGCVCGIEGHVSRSGNAHRC